MLKALRNKSTQKKIYIGLAVMIIPGFLIWGVTFSMKEGESASSALGRIENKALSLQDYLKSYKATQHQLELFYGDRAGEIGRVINLKGQAWDRLLLLHYAKKEKLKTSDSEVVDWISKQFSLKGKFDEALYKRYVDVALRSNPREFEEEVRESLTISKISEKLKSGIPLTEGELKKAYDEAHGKRDIVYGFLPWETQKNGVKVSEEELRNIYSIVKDNLTDPAQGNKKLNYEESREELTKIMSRDGAVKEAVKTLEALRKDLNPVDFEAWLAKNNLRIQKLEQFKPGDSLPFIGDSSAPVFQEKLLNLKEGEVSDVFAVSDGAAIVKVLKNTPGDGDQYAKEKEEFRKTLLSKKLDESMQKLLTDLRGKLKLDIELMKKLFPAEE